LPQQTDPETDPGSFPSRANAHARVRLADSMIKAWTPGTKTLTAIGKDGATKFDGVKIQSGGRILVSSQSDSSLHVFMGGTGRPIIRTGG
jgi:hypothetical protein